MGVTPRDDTRWEIDVAYAELQCKDSNDAGREQMKWSSLAIRVGDCGLIAAILQYSLVIFDLCLWLLPSLWREA